MKTTTLTVTQEFPFVESFTDYHEIPEKRVDLNIFANDGGTIESEEVAFHGDYWGLFWIKGQKPTKPEQIIILIDAGFEVEGGTIYTVVS
jgi:hypothetical protein